jgi:16S rRNA (cytosine1402-N4)-methyltransferase
MQLHVPVALNRCIALLTPSIEAVPNPVVVDATLGMGGHTHELLRRFPQLHVIGLDRDLSAIDIATKNLADFSSRLTIVHAVYDQISEVLGDLNIPAVDGVIFDLGVSSMQLDMAERGFAYSQEAPLDMRMDQSSGLSAQDVLNTYSRQDLVRVIRTYGEEKFATKIVDNIIAAREAGTLRTTTDLATIVKESIPAPARRTGGNPAKRTFQALRIEVNNELSVLERALPSATDRLAVGGRVVVMAYQSLEDKIVKRYFAELTASRSPLGLPVDLPNSAADFSLVIRGSEGAEASEIQENPRAASMRLRAIERLAA